METVFRKLISVQIYLNLLFECISKFLISRWFFFEFIFLCMIVIKPGTKHQNQEKSFHISPDAIFMWLRLWYSEKARCFLLFAWFHLLGRISTHLIKLLIGIINSGARILFWIALLISWKSDCQAARLWFGSLALGPVNKNWILRAYNLF